MKCTIARKPQVNLQMWKTKTFNEITFTRVEKPSEKANLCQASRFPAHHDLHPKRKTGTSPK